MKRTDEYVLGFLLHTAARDAGMERRALARRVADHAYLVARFDGESKSGARDVAERVRSRTLEILREYSRTESAA